MKVVYAIQRLLCLDKRRLKLIVEVVFKNTIVLQVGKNVDKWLGLLSARQVFPFGMGDENVANSKYGGKRIIIVNSGESFLGRLLVSSE